MIQFAEEPTLPVCETTLDFILTTFFQTPQRLEPQSVLYSDLETVVEELRQNPKPFGGDDGKVQPPRYAWMELTPDKSPLSITTRVFFASWKGRDMWFAMGRSDLERAIGNDTATLTWPMFHDGGSPSRSLYNLLRTMHVDILNDLSEFISDEIIESYRLMSSFERPTA